MPASSNASNSTTMEVAEAHATIAADSAICATITGWETYPEGISSLNPFDCDAADARRQLDEQANIIFSESDISVDIINATGKSTILSRSSV